MNKWPLHSGLCLRMVPKTLPPFENGDTDHNPPELSVYPVSCFQTKPNIIRRAGWGFSLICGLSQDKWPSKMGTYHWEGHQVFLMHICRVQSQVPFSGVCAHLRDLAKNGTGTYHWEVTGICVQTCYIYIEIYYSTLVHWKSTLVISR